MQDPLAEPRARPSAEQAMATVTTMSEQIRSAVSVVVTSVSWQPDRDAGSAGCDEPFSKSGGSTFVLQSWYAEGGVSDDVWDDAVAAAKAVAFRYGLTEIVTVVDRPADHQIRFASPTDGTYADLGTGVNAILGVYTGCFLPQASRGPVLPSSPPATQ